VAWSNEERDNAGILDIFERLQLTPSSIYRRGAEEVKLLTNPSYAPSPGPYLLTDQRQ